MTIFTTTRRERAELGQMAALTPPYTINYYRPSVESICEIPYRDYLYVIDLYMKIKDLDQGQKDVPKKNRLGRHDVGDYATLGSETAVPAPIF